MRWLVLVDRRGKRWRIEVPETRRERVRGLLGRGPLPLDRALLLSGVRSIHTFGMRAPIRAAFLDRELRVVDVVDLAPGRLTLPRLRARHVLEANAEAQLRIGDRFRMDGGESARTASTVRYSPRLRAIRRRWISEVPE